VLARATDAAVHGRRKNLAVLLVDDTRDGWWTHAIPPFATLRFDTRANKVLGYGEASTGGAGGVVLVADPNLIRAWKFAAHRLLAGDSFNAIGEALYERGIRGRHGGSLGHRHVRNILVNCALIGENEFRDRDDAGQPIRTRVQAKWPPLVDVSLFRDVENEVERRGASPRNKKRMARGGYPLRPICPHCGLEYNGTRLSKAQGEVRCYSHPIPTKRANLEAFETFRQAGCKAYMVGADELELAIKDIVLSERAS
jgi:hypothetical protein